MAYEPWPEDGCTLAEARERTAERAVWVEWQRRMARYHALGPEANFIEHNLREMHADHERRRQVASDIDELEERINAGFWSLFSEGRLIAYGRKNDLANEPRRIAPDIWPALTDVNWEASSVGEGRRGGSVFLAVRVYPVLKAPCRVDLLVDRTLVDVFRRFILADPEVAALASVAITKAPVYERVFRDGNSSIRGCTEWSFDDDENPVAVAHPDPARQRWFDPPYPPDPIEVADAADALADRYRALLEMLRRTELEGVASPIEGGPNTWLLRSVWSHSDFSFDASNGDILAINEDRENPRPLWVKRWRGVVLARSSSAAEIGAGEIPSRVSRRSADESVRAPSKSTDRVQTSARARNECEVWLISEMKQSPRVRRGKKDDWWEQAKSKWSGRLSRRAFNLAWEEAVGKSGAAAWAAAGAPPKRLRQESARP